MEISARRGPIEHQRLQIFSSGFLQPANNFSQLFFSRQHLSLFYEKSLRNISPAAGSAAAAARSSAKSAKAPTAPASTTAASASAHQKWQQPPAPAHAATTARAGSVRHGRAENSDHNKNDEQDRPETNRRAITARSVCDAARRRIAGERDAFVVGNIFCELPRGDFDGRAVIVLPEKGNHGAAGIACTRVINYWFQAVADFDAVLAIVGSEQQEHAGVVLFCAYAEMFEEIDGVVFDGAIVERADGDDGELRAGFLLEFGAKRFQAVASRRGNDSGEIGDVAGGRDFVDIVRERRACDEKEK